jgi:hypothetical protein
VDVGEEGQQADALRGRRVEEGRPRRQVGDRVGQALPAVEGAADGPGQCLRASELPAIHRADDRVHVPQVGEQLAQRRRFRAQVRREPLEVPGQEPAGRRSRVARPALGEHELPHRLEEPVPGLVRCHLGFHEGAVHEREDLVHRVVVANRGERGLHREGSFEQRERAERGLLLERQPPVAPGDHGGHRLLPLRYSGTPDREQPEPTLEITPDLTQRQSRRLRRSQLEGEGLTVEHDTDRGGLGTLAP